MNVHYIIVFFWGERTPPRGIVNHMDSIIVYAQWARVIHYFRTLYDSELSIRRFCSKHSCYILLSDVHNNRHYHLQISRSQVLNESTACTKKFGSKYLCKYFCISSKQVYSSILPFHEQVASFTFSCSETFNQIHFFVKSNRS